MLWLGHLILSRIYFGRMSLKDAVWSIAPDLPMTMIRGVYSEPWYVIKDWWIYVYLYKVPHSVVALLFVPRAYRKIYFLHSLIDILSHTGDWSIEPMFPWTLKVHGIWDPVGW